MAMPPPAYGAAPPPPPAGPPPANVNTTGTPWIHAATPADPDGIADVAAALEAWSFTRHTGRVAVQRLAHLAGPEGASSYEHLCVERDALKRRLAELEKKQHEVDRVCARFAAVRDPVVASDGYTYEREQIEKYLADCAESSVQPMSQQTKLPIATGLVQNRSLKKFVDGVKAHNGTVEKQPKPEQPPAEAPAPAYAPS